MKIVLSTHNITLTQAIQDHVQQRVGKLENYDRFCTNARVTLERDHTRIPGRQFSCALHLSMPGPDIFAEDTEIDLYSAIDLATKKIEQQLRKRHNKFKARKHTDASRDKRERQETFV